MLKEIITILTISSLLLIGGFAYLNYEKIDEVGADLLSETPLDSQESVDVEFADASLESTDGNQDSNTQDNEGQTKEEEPEESEDGNLIRGVGDIHPDVFKSIVNVNNKYNGLTINSHGLILTTKEAVDSTQNEYNSTMVGVNRDEEQQVNRNYSNTINYGTRNIGENNENNLALLLATTKDNIVGMFPETGYYYREVIENGVDPEDGDEVMLLFTTSFNNQELGDGDSTPFYFYKGVFNSNTDSNHYTVDFEDEDANKAGEVGAYAFSPEGQFLGFATNKYDNDGRVKIIKPSVIKDFVYSTEVEDVQEFSNDEFLIIIGTGNYFSLNEKTFKYPRHRFYVICKDESKVTDCFVFTPKKYQGEELIEVSFDGVEYIECEVKRVGFEFSCLSVPNPTDNLSVRVDGGEEEVSKQYANYWGSDGW